MKQYKKNVLENLDRQERLEAFKIIGLSTTEILDMMIESHEKGIAEGVRPYVTQRTIDCWTELVKNLKEARNAFNH